MIKSRLKRSALGVFCALTVVSRSAGAQTPVTPPKVATGRAVAISASDYRATLQRALSDLRASRPAKISKVVKSLDTRYTVRRADGQVQSVTGNFWSNFGRTLGQPKSVTPSQVKRARQALGVQIRALDEWTKTPAYQPTDARKIVADLAASGQIRVGPLWWQKLLSDAWATVAKALASFMKWLSGLLPKATPLQNTRAPSDKWLWVLFYLVVAAILGMLLWFAFRAFGGNLGRRATKRGAALHSEDEALLQLPPDELLSRAERYAAQGNFREALRHRYLSLLLDLDARGVWRYDARRTNWEHIASLGRQERGRELVTPLADLTKRFDRVRYGGAACDDSGWRRFDGDARELESRATPGQKMVARETEMAR